jgi:hypothetical protein
LIPFAHVTVMIAPIMSPRSRTRGRVKAEGGGDAAAELDDPAEHGEQLTGMQVRGVREVGRGRVDTGTVEPPEEPS